MAHQHLHFKEDIAAEHTAGKQIRVSLALLGTLAGGTLLISSGVSKLFYGNVQTQFLAMLGAIFLGAPIVIHAVQALIKRENHR